MGLPYGEYCIILILTGLIHPCDRRTNRQTNGRAIAYSALSIMLYAVAR